MRNIIRQPIIQPNKESEVTEDKKINKNKPATINFNSAFNSHKSQQSQPEQAESASGVEQKVSMEAQLQQQQEKLAAERKAVLQAAEKQGYQAGWSQGEQDANKELAEQIKRLTNIVALLQHEQEKRADIMTKKMVELIPAIVYSTLVKLIGKLVPSPDLISSCIDHAIAEISGDIKMVIRLHPADLELLQKQVSEDSPWLQSEQEQFRVLADPKVTGGGCIIETDQEDIDAQLTTQFEALKKILLKYCIEQSSGKTAASVD